jgi:hypothetical protein
LWQALQWACQEAGSLRSMRGNVSSSEHTEDEDDDARMIAPQ